MNAYEKFHSGVNAVCKRCKNIFTHHITEINPDTEYQCEGCNNLESQDESPIREVSATVSKCVKCEQVSLNRDDRPEPYICDACEATDTSKPGEESEAPVEDEGTQPVEEPEDDEKK